MIRNHLFLCLISILACFVTYSDALESIVGGDKARENQFPYQVALRYHHGRSYCGGGIIDDYFILTAAHCVVINDAFIDGMPISILAGTNDLNKTGEPAMNVKVKKVFVPMEYQPPIFNATADIAVIMLRDSLRLRHHENMKALKLPYPNPENYTGKVAEIAGFGWDWIRFEHHNFVGGQTGTQLLFAESCVIDQRDRRYGVGAIPEKHICAKVKQRSLAHPRGVCHADSGGPLVYNGTVIGILVRGAKSCAEQKRAATYTRVSHHLDFIENAMKDRKTDDSRTFDVQD